MPGPSRSAGARSRRREIVGGWCGLEIAARDPVQVRPPYDTTTDKALVAANPLFVMLCILPGAGTRQPEDTPGDGKG